MPFSLKPAGYAPLFFLTAFAAFTVFGVTSAWADPPAAWSPDKTQTKQLAPATAANEKYQIQPPKGHTVSTMPGPGGSEGKAWRSAPRADGTRVYVMFVAMNPPADAKKMYTTSEVLEGMVGGIHRRRTDWKQSPTQTGTINGVPFVRTYWQGTDTETGLPMRGFNYVAQDGKGFIQLSSQEIETYAKTTLPIMEASVLTFKKKQTNKEPM